MITYLSRSIAQLSDPRLRNVVLLAVAGALAAFAGLWTGVWWMLANFDPSGIWGLGWLAEWMGGYFDWVAGVTFFAAMLIATFLMFPAVVTVVVGLFLERVAAAVEDRHYPSAGPARPQPLVETLGSTLKFAATVILLNLLVLPLYLVLVIVPGSNLVLYYLLNGYLIGREYYELVAFRRLPPREATRLRRRFRSRVLVAGIVVAFLMTVPVVNLIAPVIGAAFMVHVVHDLLRRSTPQGTTGPAGNQSASA